MSKSNLEGTPLAPKRDDGQHTSVPERKRSTKSFHKGSQNLYMNSDVIPAAPEGKATNINKGSQPSANGTGAPQHTAKNANRKNLGKVQRASLEAIEDRESGDYDREGGWNR